VTFDQSPTTYSSPTPVYVLGLGLGLGGLNYIAFIGGAYHSNINNIFGVRKLESLGYHAAFFA